MLHDTCSKLDSIITDSENYQLLVIMLKDQTTMDEKIQMITDGAYYEQAKY
ncbi:hypothetical protein [Clostridium estertheticum]|uniref:Uncharacterized protein n=1 Tax=Clostridium estertheticum TaxID=238834 RepID=A0A7Y3WR84_9CLOT|nr:hypothetical protein [Clostridium estertheticum]MBW9172361.1 hypothetical protein [Clostridium estertheticum]NNU74698.1 hypothetical protein [Clostridium estertheticum]WBL48811.1 hypothetical protein LOR37_09175 [Clostridium estertheticum]WLC76866.1 hypothetical protein KTC99_08750 [Clostridium estertheticum]